MERLTQIARVQGLEGFTAAVLPDNARMLHLFHKCGFAVETSLEDGAYSLRIPFSTDKKQPTQPAAGAVSKDLV